MEHDVYKESKRKWDEFSREFKEMELIYPDENLVRLFSGRYVPVPGPPAKLLDHGFGSGNNLLFFARKGYYCFGCEISRELISLAQKKFREVEAKCQFSMIEGTALKYEDDFFDIIVSWNSIHYNGTKNQVQKVIDEFHRILRPGGLIILSTIHPDNSIVRRGRYVDDDSFIVEEDSRFDNRKGLLLFAPKDGSVIIDMFSEFTEIKSGYYCYNLFLPEKKHAARLVYAKKG